VASSCIGTDRQQELRADGIELVERVADGSDERFDAIRLNFGGRQLRLDAQRL
jgi:hypothetical protein